MNGYVPGEQPRDRAYIKLNTNENPYPPSPRVLAAIRAAVTADLRLYPDPFATELRAKAGDVYGFSPEFVMVGNGSDELLSIVFRSCAGAGDRVVYPTPTYSLYDTLVAIQGATTVAVPFSDDFRLPVERLGEQGQVLTIVCNPNAPSGTLAPISAIEEVARSVRGLLVVDEAYVDFASDSALALVHRCENVIVLRTFSKSFSLCGMRVGLAFGHPDLLAELAKVKDSYNVDRLGLAAATAALDDIAFMQSNAARVRSTRSALSAGLRELGFDVLPSETNFVLARRPRQNLAPVQQKLKERGVLVRYFGIPELRDALRITVGTPEEVRALLAALGS
jgi:histidinol-phosphate aminotransferase